MQLQANAAAFYSVRSFVLVCILLIFHFLFVVARVAIYNLVYQLEYLQALQQHCLSGLRGDIQKM